MPGFTPGGVQYPLPVDAPRRQDLEDLARSIDEPNGLTFAGKVRRLANTSGQSISHSAALATTTVSGWSASGGDQGNATGITLSGPGDSLTVSEAGIYLVNAFVAFNAASTGARRLIVSGTGISPRHVTTMPPASPAIATAGPVSDILALNAGDTIAVGVGQSSGSALTLTTGSGGNLWVVAKMRAL